MKASLMTSGSLEGLYFFCTRLGLLRMLHNRLYDTILLEGSVVRYAETRL